MRMSLGEQLRVTLFGESHGPSVGALVEGIPPGIEVDREQIQLAMDERKTGGKYASKRSEPDFVEILSGVNEGKTTGWPIMLLIRNNDSRSTDYSFLPDIPRPGHADLPMMTRSEGNADLNGGGSSSARLTAGLVAAAAICHPLLQTLEWNISAHTASIGEVNAEPLTKCFNKNLVGKKEWDSFRCHDEKVYEQMVELVNNASQEGNSLGSSVELSVSGLPMGLGEPWFDGVEPALARGLMAIPAARAVEFGLGCNVATMSGSEHNSSWEKTSQGPRQNLDSADGALGGFATGSPLNAKITFKHPSSINIPQQTLDLSSGELTTLQVEGRHDPVIAPRAVSVVKAVATIVLCDLAKRGGWISER
ncbi:MAG: chorismate synthase [Euryarchaeota archaeon]|nr:chorismate synthase [Euryarchaeota archaeon]